MTQVLDAAHAGAGEPFRIGRAISRSLTVFKRGFGVLMLASVIIYAPMLIAQIALALFDGPRAERGVEESVAALVSVPLYILAQAAVICGVLALTRNEELRLGTMFASAFARLAAVLGAGLASGVLILFGLIALVVPAFYLVAMFYVVLPACLDETLGVGASLSRSRALTAGHRWPLFAVSLVLPALNFAIVFVVILFARKWAPAWSSVLAFPWTVLFTAYPAALATVVYQDLRAAKEGVAADRLTRVFD